MVGDGLGDSFELAALLKPNTAIQIEATAGEPVAAGQRACAEVIEVRWAVEPVGAVVAYEIDDSLADLYGQSALIHLVVSM